MNIDLDKTIGYDMAKQAGIGALHKTLASTSKQVLAQQIQKDLTMLVNQAINTLLRDPMKPGATILMAQMVGYLGELAELTGTLAHGHTFKVNTDLAGQTSLVVKKT